MSVSDKRETPNYGVSEEPESTGSPRSVELMDDEVMRGDIRALPHICRSLIDRTPDIRQNVLSLRLPNNNNCISPLLQQGVKTYC